MAFKAEVRLLFHELADLSDAERERIFRERQVEPGLRAEVESLLSYDSTGAPRLTDCVSEAANEVLRSAAAQHAGACGPYRLVRLLGSGGMGSVYLAERSDGELRQTVAVKLLRAEDYRPAWRDRFLRERQLLASLNHPSIVRVLDAGHTDDGRPYLVMEYVEGTPIDEYTATLPPRQILGLFLRVCDGVAHAHRHLIVHRDLKPSNILVDRTGQPKLLDFGIAKLLDDSGETTQTVERLLTPNYASPEQIAGDVQTTASDVYSLGAVLYKLMTKRSPHESESGTSQALEVVMGRQEIPTPTQLNPEAPRDIDFILRKALRKEPEERYGSVEAFAADIRACLEFRPVQARAGDAWYRTRRFLRRYWMPVAAASVVIASLSAGLYLANRERALAERRFGQLRQLSNKVFDLDRAIKDLPGATQARQSLVAASLQYLEGLAAETEGDLDLEQELGDDYERVARVQGVPTDLNLGEAAKAEVSLRKADALIDAVLASRPRDRRALLRSAVIAQDRMILAETDHRRADALNQARKATDRLDAYLRTGNLSDKDRLNVSALYGNIALANLNLHRYAEAIPLARRAVELPQPVSSARYLVGQGLSLLASALRYQGDLDGALRSIQEARKDADHANFPNRTTKMIALYGILLREGAILGEDGGVNLNRPEQAIEPLQTALDLTEQAARADPADYTSRSRVGTAGRQLANILRHRDPQRALAVYDLANRRLAEIRHNIRARRDQALVMAESSYALRSLHRNGEARRRVDEALAILKETKDDSAERIRLDSEMYTALCAEADYFAGSGDTRRALELYEDLLARVTAAKPEASTDLRDAPHMSRLYEALARLYRQTGAPVQAAAMESDRIELWRQWDRNLPDNQFVQRQLEAARHPD